MGRGEGWEGVGWSVFLKLLSGGGGAGNVHHSSSRSAELHRCQTSIKQRSQTGGSDPPPSSCLLPHPPPAVRCTARRRPALPPPPSPPAQQCEPAWQGLNAGLDPENSAKPKANRRISWKFTFLTSSLVSTPRLLSQHGDRCAQFWAPCSAGVSWVRGCSEVL